MSTLSDPGKVPKDVKHEMEATFGMLPSFALAAPPGQVRLWWNAIRDFQLSDKTAIPPKYKELIGLGVSAQIPCHYCVLFHTEAARLNGATDDEIQEAVFMASVTRQGSTILNGSALDPVTFERELGEIVEYIKAQATGSPEPVKATH